MYVKRFIPHISVLFVSILYYVTSPHDGNFWWSDAPRHALDGIFYADLFNDLPIEDLKEYAFNYYRKYPALTILFYPPMFAIIEAFFYSLFGHSHATAQITISFFVFLAGLGAYYIARRYLPQLQAIAAAILFLGGYELAFWGRQIMLELPAYSFLLWTIFVFFKYIDTEKPVFVYLGAILFAMGIYTKLNIAFIAPVIVFMIVLKFGKKAINKHIIFSVLLFFLLILPWLLVTLKYGGVNIGAIQGGQVEEELSRMSIENWLFYARLLHRQVGLIPVVLSLLYLITSIKYKNWRVRPVDGFFLVSWFIFGYLVFSFIALKESRHNVFILYPVALFAILFINKLFKSYNISNFISLTLAISIFIKSIFFVDIPYVNGYKQAAEYVLKIAPVPSNILFSGYRDGSFVYNVKTKQDHPNISVIRADKVLLKVAIKQEMGVEEKSLSEKNIIEFINNHNIHFIVADLNFWEDLSVMKKFQNALKNPQFEKIKEIPVQSNRNIEDKKLSIYKNNDEVKNYNNMIIDIPSIDIKITPNKK